MQSRLACPLGRLRNVLDFNLPQGPLVGAGVLADWILMILNNDDDNDQPASP
jgi:hypothetical protein